MIDPKTFYKSKEWRKIRLAALAAGNYQCSCCGVSVKGKGKSRVDHRKPVRQFPQLSLVLSNLRVFCASCDNKRHSEKGGGVIRNEVDENGYPQGWA